MGDYVANETVLLNTHVISRNGGLFTTEFFDNESKYASLNEKQVHEVVGTVIEPIRSHYTFGGWQDTNGNILVKYYKTNGNKPHVGISTSESDYIYLNDIKDGSTYEPIWYDLECPTITSITTTTEFSETQEATIKASDAGGIDGYYIGQVKPTDEAIATGNVVFEKSSASEYTKTIDKDGIWYFGVMDESGNWLYESRTYTKAFLDCSQEYINQDNLNIKISYILGEKNKTIPFITATSIGYMATKWTINGQNVSSYDFSVENSICIPVWETNKYTLTYNANGGSCTVSNKTVAYKEAYGTLPTPSKTSFTFNGWFTSSGVQVSSSTIMDAQDCTIYAKWTGNFAVSVSNLNYTYTGDASKSKPSINVTQGQDSGYTITYGTTYGSYNLSSMPAYTNVGTYTIYYKVSASGYYDYCGSYTVTITKATATLTLSSSSGTIKYPTTQISFSLSSNLDLSEILITSSNTSVATVSRSGSVVYVSAKSFSDSATITCSFPSSTNYTSITKTYTVTTKKGDISYSASGYGGAYDGAYHTGSLIVNTSGCKVLYGTSAGSYTTSTMPSYCSAGSYQVYYQITGTNYNTVTGSFAIVLRKSSAMTIYDKGQTVDIKSGSIATTYRDQGYRTLVYWSNSSYSSSANQVAMASSNTATTLTTGLTCTRRVYSNEVGQVVFEFNFTNNSGSTKYIGASLDTDLYVNGDDGVPCSGTNTGFYMSSGGATFDFFCRNYAGIKHNATGLWVGAYSSRTSYLYYNGTTSSCSGIDSGMAVCWHNIRLPNGSSDTINCIFDMR